MKKYFTFIIIIGSICLLFGCTTPKQEDTKLQQLITLIDTIPSDISLEDEGLLNTIEQKYNALSLSDQKEVTNYQKYITALNSFNILKEKDETDKENKKIVDNTILSIDSLPSIDKVTLNDEEAINLVRLSYNQLSSTNQLLVTNYDKLVKLENKIVSLKKANEVSLLISNLPNIEEVSLTDEILVKETRIKYNSLTNEEQTYVTNINTLIAVEEQILKLTIEKEAKQKAQIVITAINNLPLVEELTLDDETAINDVKSLFINLQENEKEYVTNLDQLTKLVNKLKELKEEETKKQNALVVDNKITSIGTLDHITLSNELDIIEARTLYEALSSEEKAYVKELSLLVSFEEKIKELKSIELMKNKAKLVDDLITDLPLKTNLTIADDSLLLNARAKYNELSNDEKKYVTKLSTLVNLEQRMVELKQTLADQAKAQTVIDEINNLPNIDQLLVTDEARLINVRTMYNNLTTSEKGYVTNLDTLIKLEEKMKELKDQQEAYQVYFALNGGSLEGVTLCKEKNTLIETIINNYSTGYWTYYGSEVIVFKTSLIKEGDLYTSALKLGFSFNESTNSYVIDQIIEAGVGLTNETKTSTYFIFVHADNSSSYSLLSQVAINDEVEFDKVLPDAFTSSFGATLKVYHGTKVSTNLYEGTFKGTVTLKIPTRSGYKFMGWYDNASFNNNSIEVISSTSTLYAKWLIDKGETSLDNVFNCISDIATSDTEDVLLTDCEEATIEWSSSNPNLYVIENGIGKVSKVYQTHQTQKVIITAQISYKNGSKETKTKEIIVNPVLYNDLPSTPIATYFYTDAASQYKKFNERYLANGTLFSESTKETLDIVYYSFVTIDASGNCYLNNTSYINEVNKLKAYDVRIIASINGVSQSASLAFTTITADDALRAKFINNLINLADKYNFDGFDIDWESVSGAYVKAAGMNALVRDLRAKFDEHQVAGGTPYFLSAAIPASSWGTSSDRFDFITLNKYLDYINIMSYDMNKTDITSHLSPLYKSSYDNGYGFGCQYGVDIMTSKGFDRSKLIIGCAGYGKAYKVTGTSSNSKYPGLGTSGTLTIISGVSGSFNSGTVYGNVIATLIATGKYTKYLEYNTKNQVVGSYLYNETDKIFVTYDSEEVVMAKYAYANAMTGVGMMCWCYCEDTSDTVINAIAKAKLA